MKNFIGVLLLVGLMSCNETKEEIWVMNCNEEEICGFNNLEGEVKIAAGKYLMIFTDTFTNYAIVLKEDAGFVGIDKKENVLYTVFTYDNGPDYVKDGYFRITKDNKMGFANYKTGAIEIAPQYAAARPFENGYAAICPDCETKKELEHSSWVNGKWGLLDKKGVVVIEPKYDAIQSISKEGKVVVIENGAKKTIDVKI